MAATVSPGLPTMTSSLNTFVEACQNAIDALLHRRSPDMALVILLDDAIHLAHEVSMSDTYALVLGVHALLHRYADALADLKDRLRACGAPVSEYALLTDDALDLERRVVRWLEAHDSRHETSPP